MYLLQLHIICDGDCRLRSFSGTVSPVEVRCNISMLPSNPHRTWATFSFFAKNVQRPRLILSSPPE